MHPVIRNLIKDFLQRVYLRDQFLWRLPGAGCSVGLTFDDGPDAALTPKVLDLLAQYNIKATFFVIGRNVECHPEIAHRIVKEGHSIGGHTFSHRVIASMSKVELENEMTRCRQAIRDATGVDTYLFRPPKGQTDISSLRRVCSLGYRIVHWSKTYSDYRCDGSAKLLERMYGDPVCSKDVILLHDHISDTVEALSVIIPIWKSQGFQFETL